MAVPRRIVNDHAGLHASLMQSMVWREGIVKYGVAIVDRVRPKFNVYNFPHPQRIIMAKTIQQNIQQTSKLVSKAAAADRSRTGTLQAPKKAGVSK